MKRSKTFNNLCEGRASVESVDLNGKILEMKISTEIGDGSWLVRFPNPLASGSVPTATGTFMAVGEPD